MVLSTYCPYLWEGITLDHKLNVYSCCLIKPGIIGNLYEGPLSSFINSDKLLKYRRKSLNGRLQCYNSCNLIDKNNNYKNNKKLEIQYKDLSTIHIHFGNKCNIKCIMCDHPQKYALEPIIADGDQILSQVDLTNFENIIIQGGEPLNIKECLSFLRVLDEKEISFTLLTNGIIINDEIASLLARRAKKIIISLNAASKALHETINKGSNYDIVLNNIKKIIHYRRKYNSEVVIIGRMTITIKGLPDIPNFIRNFHKIGLDEINFGYVRETVPKYLDKYPDIKNQLIAEINKAISESDLEKIDLLRLIQLELVSINIKPIHKMGFLN